MACLQKTACVCNMALQFVLCPDALGFQRLACRPIASRPCVPSRQRLGQSPGQFSWERRRLPRPEPPKPLAPRAQQRVIQEFARQQETRQKLVAQPCALTAAGTDADYDSTVDTSRQLRENMHQELRLTYRYQARFPTASVFAVWALCGRCTGSSASPTATRWVAVERQFWALGTFECRLQAAALPAMEEFCSGVLLLSVLPLGRWPPTGSVRRRQWRCPK